MLFHEIYGSYFNVVAKVLDEACAGDLTDKRLGELVRQNAFGESALTIPASLKDGEWHLLTQKLKTPLMHPPSVPLTTLQKRWMKALLSNPRIKLFGVSDEGLSDVEPLYEPGTFKYFDRYTDGDPFEDERYIANFRTALAAIRHEQLVEVTFEGRAGRLISRICFPRHLEYSSKDDKFRILAASHENTWTFNMARVHSIDVLGSVNTVPPLLPDEKRVIVMELADERNALERVLLHFSHLEKETVRLDDSHYEITLHYDRDDETEILIRVLSFGPVLRVKQPESFISLIKDRLIKQKSCGLL